jgi:hypothetical protein
MKTCTITEYLAIQDMTEERQHEAVIALTAFDIAYKHTTEQIEEWELLNSYVTNCLEDGDLDCALYWRQSRDKQRDTCTDLIEKLEVVYQELPYQFQEMRYSELSNLRYAHYEMWH